MLILGHGKTIRKLVVKDAFCDKARQNYFYFEKKHSSFHYKKHQKLHFFLPIPRSRAAICLFFQCIGGINRKEMGGGGTGENASHVACQLANYLRLVLRSGKMRRGTQ